MKKHPNHSQSIMINQISSMTNERISGDSYYKNHFDKALPDYNIALKNSGFTDNVIYIPSQSKRKCRKKQVIWFNPDMMLMCKLGGEMFMRLADKHFPSHHKYYRLFNRNNIKLSYSCIPSVNNVIRKHLSKIWKIQHHLL